MAPKGPYRLVTVNTAPERAALIVGRMIERLADQYAIEHAANCKSMASGITTTETIDRPLTSLKA